MEPRYEVSRDGVTRATFPEYWHAAAYLLTVQGQSIDWATKYEGWAITVRDTQDEVNA
jgi:hypothetical protein